MSLTNKYLYGDSLPLARKLLLRFSETRLHSTAFVMKLTDKLNRIMQR